MSNQDKRGNGFPDHLTADAWDFDLHAYQTRNMKADMEPAQGPEPMGLQYDRCGNTTRPLGWQNGETLCAGPGGCSGPTDREEEDEEENVRD